MIVTAADGASRSDLKGRRPLGEIERLRPRDHWGLGVGRHDDRIHHPLDGECREKSRGGMTDSRELPEREMR
jgi:hypothetical protein